MKASTKAMIASLLLSFCTVANSVKTPAHYHVSVEEAMRMSKSVTCLAQVIYSEARGEPDKGKIAVGNVVMNRHESWNRTVCGVVYHRVGKSCQFSGLCTKKNAKFNEETKEVAFKVFTGRVKDVTKGATYFHAVSVKPAWSKKFEKTKRIGNHVFYRTKEKL